MLLKSLIILFFISISPLQSKIDPADARVLFPKAVESEEACRDFLKKLKDLPEDDYLMRAYRGAANIVMAKFMSMPNKRLSYFLDGKEELDLGVEKLPANVEIRYLRFRIQENTPAMLLYDDNDEDLPVIVNRIKEVKDEAYRKKIINFVLSTGKCTDEQAQKLKSQ